MTQRLVGHYIGDMEQYRQPGEMERLAEQEPAARLARELRAAGVPDAEIDRTKAEASREIEAAATEALAAPPADVTTVRSHVYA
jgi:pyruvate dehydrogenase E1 component alpha subunit